LGRRCQKPAQQRITTLGNLALVAFLLAHVREDSMTDQPSATVPSYDALEAAFAPYITAAGEVVNAWNKLQKQLSLVFVATTGMPKDMATAIWHSVRSDAVQRDMLNAAIVETNPDIWKGRLSSAKDDLERLLKVANKLSKARNDAIHAPVALAIDNGKLIPFPNYFHGNPRAKNLKGKDIVTEFRRLRDNANTLREFAEKAETALNHASYAWPDRPALLEPPPKKNPEGNPDRQARKEWRQHQPKASQQ
jgi:hypothetical protein